MGSFSAVVLIYPLYCMRGEQVMTTSAHLLPMGPHYIFSLVSIDMPANKKYLSSPFQRFLKITAGFIGGYLVMISFHLLISVFVDKANMVVTASFTGYILWAVLLLVAFLSRNGWVIWGIYIVLCLLFSLPFLYR